MNTRLCWAAGTCNSLSLSTLGKVWYASGTCNGGSKKWQGWRVPIADAKQLKTKNFSRTYSEKTSHSLAGAGGVNFFILRGGIFILGVEFLFWGGIFILRVEFLFGWNLGVEFLGMELSLMPNKRARSGNLCSVYSDQPALRTTVLGRPNPQGHNN